MSLDRECCESYSCCGNCKAVHKAVTILYFRPLVISYLPPPPTPLTYSGLVGEQSILIPTQPPPLFHHVLPLSVELSVLLCFKWQLCTDNSCGRANRQGKLVQRLAVLLCY